MEVAIITALKDSAAVNIKYNLLHNHNFLPQKNYHILELPKHILRLYQFDSDSIFLEGIDEDIKADIFIFPTKHQSSSGINSLSVHSPGNWHKADYGGKDKTLCICPANLLKKALNILNSKADHSKYDIVQEVTHHGPFIEKPIMFIEIGSNEEQWKNPDAGKIIADTIIELFTSEINDYKSAFGIGGLHTTPNFKKIILGDRYSLGHVCPKYMLDHLTKEMVIQAMEKTVPKSNVIILDWKGMKENKQRILDMISELGISYERTDRF